MQRINANIDISKVYVCDTNADDEKKVNNIKLYMPANETNLNIDCDVFINVNMLIENCHWKRPFKQYSHWNFFIFINPKIAIFV